MTGLLDALQGRRIVVCAGAGGVGKTTVAAAIAVRAARAGRQVACLTIDPARRLADSLGVQKLAAGEELRDVTAALGADVASGGALGFGMLDARRTFAALIHARVEDPVRARRILDNKLYRYLSGSLSGLEEYMALERLAGLAADPALDLVVLDTPPTANAVDFFTAPRRMREALDGQLVRMMRRAYGGAERVGIDVLGRSAGVLLRALTRFTGAELFDEMVAFIDALSDLFGGFGRRADEIERLLHGPEVTFCLVSTADRSTLRETREYRTRLAGLGLRTDALIFNRLHLPFAPPPPTGCPDEARERIAALNADWNLALAEEQRIVSGVSSSWSGLAFVGRVPLLPDGASRIAALDLIGAALDGQRTGPVLSPPLPS